ncbi:MAG: hypothetical protein GY747_02900 [Planctomycetes bacterium]|nr:hypothetical protein [Planctomycetota bacterium]MCP4770150.1 hypothetical protein [Planctomycetota bacterium]MCP4860702.1 hypothetical protein [Planctomycetota bacterium]
MNRILRILPWAFMAIAAWLGLQACSSMQGKLAPPLIEAEIIGSNDVSSTAAASTESWKLLAFFGPN